MYECSVSQERDALRISLRPPRWWVLRPVAIALLWITLAVLVLLSLIVRRVGILFIPLVFVPFGRLWRAVVLTANTVRMHVDAERLVVTQGPLPNDLRLEVETARIRTARVVELERPVGGPWLTGEVLSYGISLELHDGSRMRAPLGVVERAQAIEIAEAIVSALDEFRTPKAYRDPRGAARDAPSR